MQASFDVDSTRPEYAFGFLATIGYGAAWYMEELPARDGSGDEAPDLVLTLFQDTVWYDLDAGTAVRLAAWSEAFGPDGGPAARTDLAGIVERLTAGMAEPAGRAPGPPPHWPSATARTRPPSWATSNAACATSASATSTRSRSATASRWTPR